MSDDFIHELKPGSIVDGFQVEKRIGNGAMAIVYLAREIATQRPVALKVLNESLSNNWEFVERFRNEAHAASVLSHPNIIRAISTGMTADGMYYFCMEYVEGESFQDIINHDSVIPISQALALCLEICDALEYGWNKFKFTHGDIKPENIMVTTDGHAKLADFGLARVDGVEYNGKDIVLTPFYAAPELIKGTAKGVNCLSDIYAFGSTLFHIVIGEPPFPGKVAQEIIDKQLHEIPEPLILRMPEAPKELSELIDQMLEKEPSKRPQSWTEIKKRLNEIYANYVMPQKSFQDEINSITGQRFQAKLHTSDNPGGHSYILAILLCAILAGVIVFALMWLF